MFNARRAENHWPQLAHLGQKVSRGEDFDAKRLSKNQEIIVSGDDNRGSAPQGAGQERVVIRIPAALLSQWHWLINSRFALDPLQPRVGIDLRKSLS